MPVRVSSQAPPSTRSFEVQKTRQQWLQELGGFESTRFWVLREGHTEEAFSGEYATFYPRAGIFRCAGCGLPLYSAAGKVEPESEDLEGWPIFSSAIYSQRGCHVGVEVDPDGRRLEIICKRCGGHLGHVIFQEDAEDH